MLIEDRLPLLEELAKVRINTLGNIIAEAKDIGKFNLEAAIFSAYLAHDTVDMDAAWQATYNSMGGKVDFRSQWSEAWGSALEPEWKGNWRESRELIKESIIIELSYKLPLFNSADATVLMKQTSWAMAELISLNWLIQFGQTYYRHAFTAAYAATMESELNKEQVLVIIETPFQNVELKDNQYIEKTLEFIDYLKQIT